MNKNNTIKSIRFSKTPALLLSSDVLRAYPQGTRVRIGKQVFCRLPNGSFWREDGHTRAIHCESLEALENKLGSAHKVVSTVKPEFDFA